MFLFFIKTPQNNNDKYVTYVTDATLSNRLYDGDSRLFTEFSH